MPSKISDENFRSPILDFLKGNKSASEDPGSESDHADNTQEEEPNSNHNQNSTSAKDVIEGFLDIALEKVYN